MPAFECTGTRCLAVPEIWASKKCATFSPGWMECRSRIRDELTFGPAHVAGYQAEFADDKLGRAQVDFHVNWFARVHAAMVEKFGPPTSTSVSTVQNRMGATFESQTIVWRIPPGEVRLIQRYGDVDSSVAIFADDAYATTERRSLQEKAKATAKNL